MELVVFGGAAFVVAVLVIWLSRSRRGDVVSQLPVADADRADAEFSESAPLLQTGTSGGPGGSGHVHEHPDRGQRP